MNGLPPNFWLDSSKEADDATYSGFSLLGATRFHCQPIS
jgi:hypothetical protein